MTTQSDKEQKQLWVCHPDDADSHITEYKRSVISGCAIHPVAGGSTIPMADFNRLIAEETNTARLDELKKLWGYAREHTITDIEMIMHQSGGKIDFIEAVDTKYFEERYSTLKANNQQSKIRSEHE